MWWMVLWQQLDSEVRKGLGTTSHVTAANLVRLAPCPGCDQQELAKDQPVPQAPLSPITSKRKEMEKHREIIDEPVPTSEMLWVSTPQRKLPSRGATTCRGIGRLTLQNPTNQTLFSSTDLVNLTSSFSKSICRCSLIFGRKKQMPRQAGVRGQGSGQEGMAPTHHSLWPRACTWQRRPT